MFKTHVIETGLASPAAAKPEKPVDASVDALLSSTFTYSSVIPAPLRKVWALYTDVNTINRISPVLARVNFERVDLPLRAGAEIIFVGKYPPYWRWHARLETFVEQSHFIDLQVRGPFAFWRHQHLFMARGAATEMSDHVTFSLPGGRRVNQFAGPLIKILLRFYFRHRHRQTRALLQTS